MSVLAGIYGQEFERYVVCMLDTYEHKWKSLDGNNGSLPVRNAGKESETLRSTQCRFGREKNLHTEVNVYAYD